MTTKQLRVPTLMHGLKSHKLSLHVQLYIQTFELEISKNDNHKTLQTIFTEILT